MIFFNAPEFQMSPLFTCGWLKRATDSLILCSLRDVIWFPSLDLGLSRDAEPVLGLGIRSLQALVWSSWTLSFHGRSLTALRLTLSSLMEKGQVKREKEIKGKRERCLGCPLPISSSCGLLSHLSWLPGHCGAETSCPYCVSSKFLTHRRVRYTRNKLLF